ncbi:MAG: D-alanyl-D-alanine carboxypeptidase/D-alanyl-D-alanine-endopeptidase [Bacteroidota bacterium]
MKTVLNKKLTLWQTLAIAGISVVLFYLVFFPYAEVITQKIEEKKYRRDSLLAADSAEKDTTPLERLLHALDTLSKRPELMYAGFGFSLVSPDSNTVIAEYNSKQALVPASVMKIVTTGVALARLGAGYRYTTQLQYDGNIEGGVLKGNIYIRGTGDPTLGSETFGSTSAKTVLANWTAAIKSLGIDSITGAIIGDAEYFEPDPIPGGWAWEDMQSSYGIGTCGLSWRENTYDVCVSCKGNSTYAYSSVPVPGLKLYNRTVVNENIYKPYLYVAGAPYQEERVVLGEVKGDYSERSNIPDPALACAYNLLLSLRNFDIAVKDSCTTVRKLKLSGQYERKERKTIHTTYSPSLAQIVTHCNKVSQNFYAETILKTLGAGGNSYGSVSGGIGAVINYFREKGVSLHGFFMADGSGVSRFNALSAKFLTDILVCYAKDSSMFRSFYNSLPVAGESGTLSNVGEETIAAGNIAAKSGYMSRVRSYAGYVTTQSGRLLAFSMTMNNQEWDATQTRLRMEKLMELMAGLD